MQEDKIEEQNTHGSFLIQDEDDNRTYGTSTLSLEEINELITEMRF